MAAFSTIATVASAVIGAAGALQQGKQAQDQANFQATVQQQQADREKQIAAQQEEDFRRQQSRVMAQRRAAMGASGVEASSGSPLLVSEDMASEVEFQARRIRQGGEVNSTRLNQQAALNRVAGRNARTGSFARAGASLLKGVGSFVE